MDLHHKSQAYCVSTITRMHSFPCFDQSHGIVTKHLFPDFTCSRPMLVFEIAKQVEVSIRRVVKGCHECPCIWSEYSSGLCGKWSECCRVPCVCYSESTLHFPSNYHSVIFPFGCKGECSRCMLFCYIKAAYKLFVLLTFWVSEVSSYLKIMGYNYGLWSL